MYVCMYCTYGKPVLVYRQMVTLKKVDLPTYRQSRFYPPTSGCDLKLNLYVRTYYFDRFKFIIRALELRAFSARTRLPLKTSLFSFANNERRNTNVVETL